MEKVMDGIRGARGAIVDIRGFYGGYDPVSQYIAGCFASSRKLYMTTRKRNGPAHTDFTAPLEWFVEPQGETQFIKPVVVLTSLFTQSAGETFQLAITQFDHVATVGDTTAGSFSDNPNFELPNGWIFSVSVGDYRASDGKSYEGIGLAPKFPVVSRKEDLLAGKDRALEKAIELFN
jgi:C-terminal processing protease CtpA/Prc